MLSGAFCLYEEHPELLKAFLKDLVFDITHFRKILLTYSAIIRTASLIANTVNDWWI